MEHSRSLRKESPKGLSRPATKMSMSERSPEMKKVDSMTADLVVEIMNSATSFHKLHLQVTGNGSYAQHIALNEIYDALPGLADTIAEGYQGACEVLLNYQNFQSSGMVIKKEVFEEYGAFKKNFKLTFVYEMLLRLSYNSVKIMTIPRIGYKHSNMREGSIFWNYKNGDNHLSNDEVLFWIESAKKEHFFNADRDIKYEPEIS